MVLVQKWRVFQLFFSGNIGQENVFYDILDRKYAFLTYKKKKFKKVEKLSFLQWFWSKIWIFFHSLCLGKIGREILFADILDRKEGIL